MRIIGPVFTFFFAIFAFIVLLGECTSPAWVRNPLNVLGHNQQYIDEKYGIPQKCELIAQDYVHCLYDFGEVMFEKGIAHNLTLTKAYHIKFNEESILHNLGVAGSPPPAIKTLDKLEWAGNVLPYASISAYSDADMGIDRIEMSLQGPVKGE